jgi:pyrimidine-nucleoside phosphorylase
MAASGRQLDLSSIPGRKVDKHSTGGVGDKATIVVAPLVAAAGIPVAKLSGRALGHSGGTLDKLEAIPGFQVDLSIERFIEQVRSIGIAIAGQTADMVPADKVLYALRDATATVDSLPLIASSVMSKKLAAGADAILLDVKCGRGAFVETLAEAETLAKALVGLGTSAGRETVAYVTDMEQPLGRAVGNALEIKEAIATLGGHGPPELEMLCLRLGEELRRLARHPGPPLRGYFHDGSALRKFAQLVEAQGGDPQVIEDPSRLPTAPVQWPVKGFHDGVVARADALEIALVGKALGAGRDRKDAPIDLAVGVVLEKKVGDRVEAGEPLAVIHARTEEAAKSVAKRLAAAFTVTQNAVARPLLLRRVTASGIERLDT